HIVAFRSSATDLTIGGDTNGNSDVFAFDLTTSGPVSLISQVPSSTATGNSLSDSPSISADGRYVAFRSFDSNLVSGFTDTNGNSDVFVRDRSAGSTSYASPNSTNNNGSNNTTDSPSIGVRADGHV